jgi:YVTN family beta-propeller protein
VRFTLPDRDVFARRRYGNPPSPVAGPAGIFGGVGTVLFNMAVNPVSGRVYVSNTDTNNATRFEGPGMFGGSNVRGHLHESHISILDRDGSVAARHINKHIDHSKCCAPIPNPENDKSLAFPTGLEITHDVRTLYVAALGRSKVGIFDTVALENHTFVPSTGNQVHVSGGGPKGLVLNENAQMIYVMTRFDNSISVVDTTGRREIAHISLYNPEPASVIQGRRLLYDAQHTSSHGDSACASCHVFGDFDALGWDLGNPDGTALTNIMPRLSCFPTDQIPQRDFQPMKGPVVTQSLRGMLNAGPMHWRGDRNGSLDFPNGQFDETRV